MKREILFRGKSTRFNSWQYGLPYSSGYDGIIDQIVIGEYHEDVYPETVSEFTGLTDKNGVKIFEGDILKSNMYNKKWIVEFTPCDGLKLAIKYEDDFKINGIFQTHEDWRYNKISSCEIIGNIHE